MHERIIKNMEVLSSTLAGNDHFKYVNDEIMGNALWAARSLAEEAEVLCETLWEVRKQRR